MQRLHMPCHIDVEIVNTPDINAEKAINLSFNKKMIEDEIIRRSQGNLTHPIAHARNLRREFAWNVQALCRFVWNPTPTMAASMRAAGAHDRGVK